MILKFNIEYDTETKQYTLGDTSDNIELVHSGSSYYRIIGDKIYGTINCINPFWELEKENKSDDNYLTFNIQNLK
jgi:hypothetical protein